MVGGRDYHVHMGKRFCLVAAAVKNGDIENYMLLEINRFVTGGFIDTLDPPLILENDSTLKIRKLTNIEAGRGI